MSTQQREPRRRTVSRLFRRLMLALVQPAPRTDRNPTPEYYKFPIF
jgi:hypothetical protein